MLISLLQFSDNDLSLAVLLWWFLSCNSMIMTSLWYTVILIWYPSLVRICILCLILDPSVNVKVFPWPSLPNFNYICWHQHTAPFLSSINFDHYDVSFEQHRPLVSHSSLPPKTWGGPLHRMHELNSASKNHLKENNYRHDHHYKPKAWYEYIVFTLIAAFVLRRL